MSAPARRRILFLCTHNSARSQMAEGLLRHLAGDRFDAYLAGTEATQARPLAIRAMAELGIDISGQESKALDRYLGKPFDAVITVCDQANESCPVFLGRSASTGASPIPRRPQVRRRNCSRSIVVCATRLPAVSRGSWWRPTGYDALPCAAKRPR